MNANPTLNRRELHQSFNPKRRWNRKRKKKKNSYCRTVFFLQLCAICFFFFFYVLIKSSAGCAEMQKRIFSCEQLNRMGHSEVLTQLIYCAEGKNSSRFGLLRRLERFFAHAGFPHERERTRSPAREARPGRRRHENMFVFVRQLQEEFSRC